MDLNDIWQEHKTFILSVVTGLVVFLVGFLVIQSRFDPAKPEREITRSRKKIVKSGRYDKQALDAFRRDGDALKKRITQAREQVLFKVRPRFDVAANPDPRPQYFLITDQVKREIKLLCNRADVRLDRRRGASNLGLPQVSPTEKADIERTLIGLDLAQRALTMLLQAGDDALQSDRRAKGLKEIQQMSIDIGMTSSKRRIRRGAKEVVAMDLVRVKLRCSCGTYTLRSFLRRSQEPAQPLQFQDFKAETAKRTAELLTVDLTLVAALGKEGE